MNVDIFVMNTVGITHRVRVGIARTLGSEVVVTIPYNCVQTHVMAGGSRTEPLDTMEVSHSVIYLLQIVLYTMRCR
jgi:hypothetical protein